MQYRGWTIISDVCGFVATHDRNHDESEKWQINALSIENAKEEIDEKED